MSGEEHICPRCQATFPPGTERCPEDGARLAVAGRTNDRSGELLDDGLRLEALIGSGGMAQVYRAHQESMQRDVAVKLLRSGVAESSQRLRRFIQEVREASRLNHPHIVKVFDCGQSHDGELYVVMELLEGRPLTQLLAETAAPDPVRMVDIMLQVCDALAYAHSRHLVHRDLKPDNIFVRTGLGHPADFATVLDFGVAKVLSGDSGMTSVTAAGHACGTPAYMSPEQASGKPVDGRSDVYAIGVVLYQLLTRRLPFQADSSMEMVAAHVHRTPEPLPERIPRPLAAVVERALAKHPADRPHSAAGFAAELSRALVDSGLRGHRPTPQPAGPIASFNTVTFERVPMVETAGAMPVAPVGPDTPDSVPRPPSRPVARPRLGAKLALAAVVLLGGAGLAVWQPWASPQSVVPAVAPAASTAPAAQAQAARAEAEPMRLAAQAEPEAEPERAPEPEPPTPMIELVTVPPGATVREGTRVLGVTPLHVARPPEGRVRALVIEAPGRRPAAVALERSADAVLQLSLHEVAQPATPTVQPSPQRPRRTRAKREPTGVEPVAASPPPAAPAEPAPAPEEKAPATVEGLSIME